MAEELLGGQVVNKCVFEIPQSSINALNRFQKRLTNLKKHLKGVSDTMQAQSNAQVLAQKRINKSLQDGIDYFKRYEKAAKAAKASGRGGSRRTSTLTDEQKTRNSTARSRKAEDAAEQRRQDIITRGTFEEARRMKTERDREARAEQHRQDIIARGSFAEARRQAQMQAKAEAAEIKRQELIARGSFQEARRQQALIDRMNRQQARREQIAQNERDRLARRSARALATRRDTISIGYSRHAETMGNYNLTEAQQARLSGMLQRVSARFERGAISARRYNYELGRINRVTRNLGASNRSLMGTLDALHSKLMLGGAAFAAYQLGKSISKVGMDFEGYEAGIEAITGSSKEAADTMQWLNKESMELGVSLNTSTQEFMNFVAAGHNTFSMDQLKHIFDAYTRYTKAIDLSPFRYQLGLQGISQMMSGEILQAQEVRKQLGENVAGTYQILQKSVGLHGQAFKQAMRNGELVAKKELPKFADALLESIDPEGFSKAVNNTRSQFGRLATTATKAAMNIADSGFNRGLSGLATTLQYLLQVMKPVGTFLGRTLMIAMDTFLFPVRFVTAAILDLSDALGIKLNGSSTKLVANVAGLMVGFLLLAKAVLMLRDAEKALMELKFFQWFATGLKAIGGTKLLSILSKLTKLGALKPLLKGLVRTGAGAVRGAAEGAEGGLPGLIAGGVVGAGAAYAGDKVLDKLMPNEQEKMINDPRAALLSAAASQRKWGAALGVSSDSWLGSLFDMNYKSEKDMGLSNKQILDIQVHDGKVEGLVSAKIREDRENDDQASNSWSR